MKKLYVVVREDLVPGLLCAQAVHGFRAFRAAHPELEQAWYDAENNIAILGVRDEAHLNEMFHRLEKHGIPSARFYEPDLDNEHTSFACAGTEEAIKLLSDLEPVLGGRRGLTARAA